MRKRQVSTFVDEIQAKPKVTVEKVAMWVPGQEFRSWGVLLCSHIGAHRFPLCCRCWTR